MFKLRDYQTAAVECGVEFLLRGEPGSRLMIASPTGTGKSVMEWETLQRVQRAGRACWLVTPRVEILRGIMEKGGVEGAAELSEGALIAAGWNRGVTTPLRLRNAMLRGEGPTVDALIIDEAHHDGAESYKQLHLLAGSCPALGYTATPYRGTPRGTALFREAWGEPEWAITLPEAVEEGFIAFPRCRVVPLVDDESLDVRNGDFEIRSLGRATTSRLEDAAVLLAGWFAGGTWGRPTMASLPSTDTAGALAALCAARGLPVEVVTGDTPGAERQRIFRAAVACQVALIQIGVVSEGVDLPMRRLLDLAPTLSPVKWLQQVGRITRPTRPGEAPPEYVCTNRNLLRHAYLFDGLLPRAVLLDAQQQFPAPGVRSATARVVGLEALGRLKPAPLPLASGLTGYLYAMSAADDAGRVTEYAVLIHPEVAEPVWASRRNERGADGVTASYGRWRPCEAPPDVVGFASLPGSPVSEKQANWWRRAAARYGLDATVEPTRKQFAALPVLSDLGARLK